MIRDTQAIMRGDGFKGNYWRQPKTLGNEQLHPIHILPSLILCVVGLGLAAIILIFEMVSVSVSHNGGMSKVRKLKAKKAFLL